jgi:uncharacterized protein (TIGR02996 family)
MAKKKADPTQNPKKTKPKSASTLHTNVAAGKSAGERPPSTSGSDEASFVRAMQEHPEDASLRLVFADWLEERGDPRGELIRLLHTLTQSVEVPDRAKLEERLRGLLAAGVQPVGPFWTNSLEMKFAWIPAGTFMMGSQTKEKQRLKNETRHQVTLSKGLWLVVYPVTQAAWNAVMGNNPSHSQGSDLPVETVSWQDCQNFLRKFSKTDSHSYRLPTEAEWEYACRAGTTTPFSFGETISADQANCHDPYLDGKGAKTTPVGRFPPNAWGLYDMHGNVWEWCQDRYGKYPRGKVVDPEGPANGRKRVFRGGCFCVNARYVRSALRNGVVPSDTYDTVGFRVAMTPGPRQT